MCLRNGEKVVMREYGAVVRTEGSELESGYGRGEEEAEPLGVGAGKDWSARDGASGS